MSERLKLSRKKEGRGEARGGRIMEGWRKNKRGQGEQRLRLHPRQALRVRMKRMDSWQQGRLRAARPSNHELLEEGGRKERQRRKTRRTHLIHINIHIHIHIPTVAIAVAAPSYPVDVPGRCAILPPIPGPPNESSTGSRFTATLARELRARTLAHSRLRLRTRGFVRGGVGVGVGYGGDRRRCVQRRELACHGLILSGPVRMHGLGVLAEHEVGEMREWFGTVGRQRDIRRCIFWKRVNIYVPCRLVSASLVYRA
jgi:hypothetical protein